MIFIEPQCDPCFIYQLPMDWSHLLKKYFLENFIFCAIRISCTDHYPVKCLKPLKKEKKKLTVIGLIE